MKYEITKGSEKDFEGSSDKCLIIARHRRQGWIKRMAEFVDGAECLGEKSCIHSTCNWEIIAERRPITEPVVNQQLTTEWDGEGLPPVGVECEIKRVAYWFPVTIKFISGYYTVILTRGGTEDAYQTSALQFRPIRSPEDVARSNAIGEMERAYEDLTGNPAREAEEYYDLIAAGKIKGVVLDSKVSDLKININTEEMWREFEKKSDMEDVRKLIRERASRRGSF